MNYSPNIVWTEVPQNARSFMLTMVDLHPHADLFVHWAVMNIPASAREILEKASGIRDRLPAGSLELRNGFGTIGYAGPFIAPGSGLHEYAMTVYALDKDSFAFGPHAILPDILIDVRINILAFGTMIGILQL